MMVNKRRTKEEVAELKRKIIIMRKSGFSFDDIAARVEVSASNAGKLFRRAMASVPVPSAQEFLLMHNERLEHLYSMAVREANKGNTNAMGRALDALKQMADLNGYGAPKVTKNEHTGPDGGPIQTENNLNSVNFDELTQEERDALRKITERRLRKEESVH